MSAELLVLLVPGVEVMPREGHVIVEVRRAGGRLNRLHVAQPVPANVIAREEVASQRAMLVEQLRSPAVDHRRAAALRTDPTRRGIYEEHLRHRDVYVEATGRPVPERGGAHGERHTGPRYRLRGVESTAPIPSSSTAVGLAFSALSGGLTDDASAPRVGCGR